MGWIDDAWEWVGESWEDLPDTQKAASGCSCCCCGFLFIWLWVIVGSIHTIGKDEQLVVEYLNGKQAYNGPLRKLTNPFRDATRRSALILGPTEFARIRNDLTGSYRVVEGEAFEFLDAYESTEYKAEKIVLLADEYIRLVDRLTGVERIVRGDGVVIPGVWEDYDEGVQSAVFIDKDQAPIILNKADGTRRLQTTTGPYFPEPYEHILEVRQLIRVMPHESMVVRNGAGRFVTYSGKGTDGTGTGLSFFLGPFDELVELTFSTFSQPEDGEEQVVGSETVSRFDLRARMMYFQFDVRTNDNVPLRVEGSIFWRLTDVSLTVVTTQDPAGDVMFKARNAVVDAVSKVDLETFMASFQSLIQAAFEEQVAGDFYSERGVQVDSLEITKYDVTDDTISETLNLLIEEATSRLNQIEALNSDIDVEKAVLTADIWLANAQTELIQTQATNERLVAAQEGEYEGVALAYSVRTFLEGLEGSLSSFDDRLAMYRLHKKLESQNQRTEAIGAGQATLFMRSTDLNMEFAKLPTHKEY
mmetsp:Transcript_1144/g.2526  ORF Transcript_1144/g.2526 Transcript_1144/m.2526 type:complete len:531 (-) Transcript_1144:160-1752(-)|eukprot:CAMPEP_0206435672 /NCGR_PEP_ID=MMETSP0324_2-20121206/10017_1 /ASSEMBLY_ACC=CAM_ASM_000836 /TAXON_ID=2866 /ORGANISM="Crypthecodinium cohnii, Strain Seligo" /LENGTH=530 /DNA_ID=CAMNT_0053902671 /DNA_START=51 /DNA_END=1643 /DNA_ORIENTATION=-